jgi:endonuclease/exonuclease/phosphatase family metal-dependent hydrolase
MKILSLNTWGGKLEAEIAAFILEQKKSVDIFCFQEMYPPVRTLCAHLLPNYTEFYVYKSVTESDTFHQSVFVRNTIEVLDSGSVLINIPNVGLDVWVKVVENGRHLFISNHHGISRPGDKLDTPERIQASLELLNFANLQTEQKIIIGDFNLLNTTKSVSLFKDNGFVDLIKKYKVTNTRNKYAWEQHPENIQYYADFAFVSADIQEKNFEVLFDEVSDHAPLLLEL